MPTALWKRRQNSMVRLKFWVPFCVACLAIPCLAASESETPPFKPLYECSERIWDHAPLHDLNLVFVNTADRSASVFQNPKVAVADKLPPPTPDQISEMIDRHLSYFDTKLAGRDALVVVYDGDRQSEVLPAVQLAYHEGFHRVGQGGWGAGASRMRRVGLNLGLRYARAELARSLMKWVQGADTASAARYWWDQAKAQAGDEIALMVWLDRAEGSAEFVAQLGVGLGAFGCDLGEKSLTEFVGQRLQLVWAAAKAEELATFPDAESYVIGPAAMLLLRQQHVAHWEARVREGNDPVDLLLDAVKPVVQPVDAGLRQRIEDRVNSEKSARQAALKTELDQYEHAGASYLAVPGEWSGAFNFDEHGGLMSAEMADHRELPIVLSASGNFQGSLGSVTFSAMNLLILADTPCMKGSYHVLRLPDDESIDLHKPQTHYRSPSLSIDLKSPGISKVMDKAGRVFLCLPRN